MAPGEKRHHIMLQVKKRDGSIVDFDIKKIENAISRAFVAEHKAVTDDVIELLSLRVTANFNSKIAENKVNVEVTDDVRVWCGGPIFHTVHSTSRAKIEINVLSGVSTVLVALFGWMLFRSLRFLPQ